MRVTVIYGSLPANCRFMCVRMQNGVPCTFEWCTVLYRTVDPLAHAPVDFYDF